MAYIGKQPLVGNYTVLDSLTATTTDTYALTKNSVAVFPQTPANCIVSLNGVIQAPFDSYTISGSNIVFASALTASDSIDFITVLGDVLNVGTVSDDTITTAKIQDGAITSSKLSAGKVLQVIQAVKTDTFSTSSTSFTDITGLSVSITPLSTSNKILIMFDLIASTPNLAYANLVRNSTAIGIGETAGSRISCTTGNFSAGGDNNRSFSFSSTFLDSPSTTSATTYKLQIRHESGGASVYVNRTVLDSDSAVGFRPISTITLMEISG